MRTIVDTAEAKGPFYWFAVVNCESGLSIVCDKGLSIPITSGMVIRAIANRPWRSLQVVGSTSFVVLAGDNPDDRLPRLSNASISLQTPAVFNSLTTNGDIVSMPVNGKDWSSVSIAFGGPLAGGTTSQVEISVDSGTNWFACPYGRRLDAVLTNPTVTALSGGNWNGATYEVPLPANCTNIRVRCTVTGLTGTILISGYQKYVSGASVYATLYDITSAANTALDTGTLEVAGWDAIFGTQTVSGGTSSFIYSDVDDSGNPIGILTPGAAALVRFGAGRGSNLVGLDSGLSAILTRRIKLQSSTAGIGNTVRLRVHARRGQS